MYREIKITTDLKSQFKDITSLVSDLVSESGVEEGVCNLFVPHTTAGITVNENADPDVMRDMDNYLQRLVPWSDKAYRHAEGNSAAHIKASFMGSSLSVTVDKAKLKLGTWQGIYFCEFDGPRKRNLWVKFLKSKIN